MLDREKDRLQAAMRKKKRGGGGVAKGRPRILAAKQMGAESAVPLQVLEGAERFTRERLSPDQAQPSAKKAKKTGTIFNPRCKLLLRGKMRESHKVHHQSSTKPHWEGEDPFELSPNKGKKEEKENRRAGLTKSAGWLNEKRSKKIPKSQKIAGAPS